MLLSNPFRPDTRVLKEAESLLAVGYAVTIVCWDRQAEYTPEEVHTSGLRVLRIQNVPSSYGVGTGQIVRLVRFWQASFPYLKNLRPDLIHCHDFDTLPAGLLWGWLHRLPVVYDSHEHYADLVRPRLVGLSGKIIYNLLNLTEQFSARMSSAIITVDENLGSIYRRVNPRVVILGHYPALQRFQEAAHVFSRDTLDLVYVGRLSIDRGLLIYLDILRSLRSLGVPARLLLAGAFTPESEKNIYALHIQGLEEYIDFRGWLTFQQIPEFLLSADVGLAILSPEPRYIISLPVKLFEYMASGLPVIASDFPLTAQIIAESGCGQVIDPLDNPIRIAQTLREWWEHPDIPRALGKNGRQAVQEKYHWDSSAAQIDQLYQSLLK